MSKTEEALRAAHAAQSELNKHRGVCWTCGHTCSALNYCPEGKRLRQRREDAADRYYKVRAEEGR